MKRLLITALLMLFAFVTASNAGQAWVNPDWLTTLTNALTGILAMATTIIGAIILVKLAPLAWQYIKPIILRG